MELELKKTSLDAYETGGELTLTQEETAETIVPDYLPDIARIIETEGRVFLHSRELRDGKAEVSGTVRVTVLYTPEGEGGIRTLDFSIPFTVESDSRALPGCQYLSAQTQTEFLETRTLNPRKIFTHCKLVTVLTGYQKSTLCVCTDADAEPALCVEKRQEHQHAVLLTHIAEKDFTYSGEMNLSPGRDGAVELLGNRVSAVVSEAKIVGSKLIFKGVFHITVLYRTSSSLCCSSSAELPFSQIMEVEGAAEDHTADVQIQLTGTDLQLDSDDDEGRQIAVTLYFHATSLLRQAQELTLLGDLYSTAYDMSYEAVPVSLTGFMETMTRRQMVREVLEIGVEAESVLAVSVCCGGVQVNREGENVTLRTGATVRVLYQDEGGTTLVAERCLDVSCQVELPESCKVTARAVCTEEVQTGIGDRGIEVRFPVDFCIEAASRTKRVCISSARVDTDSPRDMAGKPSLVLRCLGKQESAWDLAKACNTTIRDLLSANQLESEEAIPREKLLLIPRKRA